MPIFAEYAIRETASNLWRNRLMTIAAVLTVTVSLTLVGAALLLKQGASNAEAQWQRETQVSVWMNSNASPEEIHAVDVQLKSLPYVRSCVFRDQAYSLAEAKRVLNSPSLFAVLQLKEMPTSFRCAPTQPQDAQLVNSRFSGQPGVRNVSAPYQQIHTMQKAVTVLQWIFLTIAVVLLLSAAVLILNTIRLAIFARRREVSVMKLVGATNWFIRIPFMSEGLVQGLLGSLVAAGLIFGLQQTLVALGNPSDPNSLLTQMHLTVWDAFWTDLVLIGVGVGIGVLGSLTAIRRFLDV